jgi:hypothetical protein
MLRVVPGLLRDSSRSDAARSRRGGMPLGASRASSDECIRHWERWNATWLGYTQRHTCDVVNARAWFTLARARRATATVTLLIDIPGF